MTTATLGLLVSLFCVVLLGMLFRHERITGIRVAEDFRAHLDLLVLKIEHYIHRALWYVGRDFVKQVLHYSFHTILRAVLALITRTEKRIRTMMRVNKSLAKYAERESTTRNKLEELALHKAEVALTEKEKKQYKDRSLRGL